MGERVWFATSNWKDKPNKPSCYTQAEWDARNSSKFNGVPFASPFVAKEGVREEYDMASVKALSDALNKITLPGCDILTCNGGSYSGRGMWLTEQAANLPQITKTNITIRCKEDTDMSVWDGSTFFDLSSASKRFEWNTCGCWGGGGKPLSMTLGLQNGIKMASKRSDTYIPVCGPGTHIKEISKDDMVKIVWKVSQLDITASGFSASSSASGKIGGECFVYDQATGQMKGYKGPAISLSATVSCSDKNLNPDPSAVGQESSIVSLNWDSTKEIGYKGGDGRSVSAMNSGGTDYYYQDGPAGVNGNFSNITASMSPNVYKCGILQVGATAGIDITLKPFNDRYKYIHFVDDKIYFDPTGLFNFTMSSNGNYYYLDPLNVDAPFTLTLNFLGMSFPLKVSGPQNGAWFPSYGYSGNLSGSRNFTTGSITITGKKYYPYANSKGEAVYDEDTGAQLKDPLS